MKTNRQSLESYQALQYCALIYTRPMSISRPMSFHDAQQLARQYPYDSAVIGADSAKIFDDAIKI